MDQNLNSNPNDFLWSLLENPANDANSYVYNLHRLVNDFPQSGILQALLAHASEEKNLKRASAYFSPRALFKLVNAPSTFTGVPDERIVIQPGISVNGSYPYSEPSTYEESYKDNALEDLFVDKAAPEVEAGEELISHHEKDELVADPNAEQYTSHTGGEEQHDIAAVAGEAEERSGETPPEPVYKEANHWFDTPVEEHQPEAVHEEATHEVEESLEEHLPETVYEEAAHVVEAPIEERPAEPVHKETTNWFDTPIEEPLPEPAHEVKEQPTEAVHEAAAHEVEAHNQFLGEMAHQEEEGHHFGHKAASDVYVEKAEQAHLESAEVEPPQAIELDADKEEPTPFIELPEEEPAGIAAEIPVKEEIRPEPEIPVSDDDEVYDEIVGIEDITLGQPGGQYFSFDQEFGAHVDDRSKDAQTSPEVAAVSVQSEAEQQDVSKYHDEKMPYTFMWWLDKTRKEHEQTYQPYVKPPAAPGKKAKKITDELQQQYFENIFHITSVEELDKSAPTQVPPPDFKRKEHQIIERFIKEEPQIKPQSSDKLDNENKAKKSSEDRDELVSETLASIYSDQMLYHKAIASYKKLMLKFPEKSRYFAEKIEQLEKKTN